MLNPFRNKSSDEILKAEAEKKHLDEMMKTCAENAKHILSSEWAAKYRKDLDDTMKALIRYAQKNTNADPLKDAYFLRILVNKIGNYYDLLENIQSDGQ